MIIIIVNHHSFPVSQEPTRSNMEYFEHFPMAWSGTTVWNNWNNMQHMNTQSYWTITAVCWYCDNDVSLFSLCCCHNNLHSGPVSYAIQQQHHRVVGAGKGSKPASRNQARCTPGQRNLRSIVFPCNPQKWLRSLLKHWLQSDAIKTNTNMLFFCSEDTFLGTTSAVLPQLLESSTMHYPNTFPSPLANTWFVVLALDAAFPGCDTSPGFQRVSYFAFFKSCVRQCWGLDCRMARCDSSNTLWFIKGILSAYRG